MESLFLRIIEAVHTSATLDDFFSVIHAMVGDLMPVRNFFIVFYEKDANGEDSLTFPYFKDECNARPTGRLPLRKTLTGYVIRTGKPLLLSTRMFKNLLKKGEIDEAPRTDAGGWLGVPLKIRDATVGAMVVQSYRQRDAFGQREKKILTMISGQIAIAIELARYREKLAELVKQRTHELEGEKKVQEILFDISQSVYLASGLQDFLATVHRKVGELMDARNFYIALYDKEIDKYTFPYFADQYDQAETQQPEDLHYSLTDFVRLHGALLADEKMHHRLIQKKKVKGVIGTDSLVWLGVPLQVPGKSEPIGVMTVQSYEDRRRYTEKEKRILMNISTIVAFAIDRILLVTDIIHHFSNAVTSIKGNAEMLLDGNEKQVAHLKDIMERLQRVLFDPNDPVVAGDREDIARILQNILNESHNQSLRVSKILKSLDQAVQRVSGIFNPMMTIGMRRS